MPNFMPTQISQNYLYKRSYHFMSSEVVVRIVASSGTFFLLYVLWNCTNLSVDFWYLRFPVKRPSSAWEVAYRTEIEVSWITSPKFIFESIALIDLDYLNGADVSADLYLVSEHRGKQSQNSSGSNISSWFLNSAAFQGSQTWEEFPRNSYFIYY